jgi:uncharacterized protein with HEPN domain
MKHSARISGRSTLQFAAWKSFSEATRRLTDDLKDRHPLSWANIAGAGNIYRHDYEDVLNEIVWQTVKDLEPLWRAVQVELERLNKP